MPNENLIDNLPDREALRVQAALLLAQTRSQLADIQRALGAVIGDSALHSNLAAAAAQLAGAAVEPPVTPSMPSGTSGSSRGWWRAVPALRRLAAQHVGARCGPGGGIASAN